MRHHRPQSQGKHASPSRIEWLGLNKWGRYPFIFPYAVLRAAGRAGDGPNDPLIDE